MKRGSSSVWLLRLGMGLAAVALMVYGVDSVALADGAKAKSDKPKGKSGEELYRMHCARCHIERYAIERTDAQWKTIMLHMRTRAPLPAKDAKKIEKYLQETN